jgi:hypothetical protein
LLVIKWGLRQNKQRFKCNNCGILFTRSNPDQRLHNRLFGFVNGFWNDKLLRH